MIMRHLWRFSLLFGLIPPFAHAQDALTVSAQYAKTAESVHALQNEDGGFGAEKGGVSTISTTNSAIRILKHTGSIIPDPVKATRFVKSCFVPGEDGTGAFAQSPGGKPDLITTCIAMLAWGDLQMR
jgi:prenyltransferase beta subunit